MASQDTQFVRVTLDAAVQGFVADTIIQYSRVGKQVTVQLLAADNGTFSLMTIAGGILPYADIGIIGTLLASDYTKLMASVHSPWIVSISGAVNNYVGGYCELEANQLAFKNFVVAGAPVNVAVGGHVKNGSLYYILP